MTKRFTVHCCALDPHCRRYTDGLLWRVETSTPWWHLGIALAPNSRYVHAEGLVWHSYRRKR